VEVRSGTGRYKDTQVVIFAPRYRLNNRSSYVFFVAHKDEINEPKKHIQLAGNCNLIWHENYEDKRLLCIRRDTVPHWSCPFRIDQVGSFHVTMR
jgi:vacuolar protein sorting-associated protein 13D